MSRQRLSNIKHSEWNTECRQALSEHLAKTLGISIEPSQVRLKTENTDDPYVWERLEEKEYLFSKNLSDHSMKALKELRDGVGVFFRAVPKLKSARCERDVLSSNHSTPLRSSLEPDFLVPEPPVSFSSRIADLKLANEELAKLLRHSEEQLNIESEGRREAEEQVMLLKQALQKQTKKEEELVAQLSQCQTLADALRSVITECNEGLGKVLPLLDAIAGPRPRHSMESL